MFAATASGSVRSASCAALALEWAIKTPRGLVHTVRAERAKPSSSLVESAAKGQEAHQKGPRRTGALLGHPAPVAASRRRATGTGGLASAPVLVEAMVPAAAAATAVTRIGVHDQDMTAAQRVPPPDTAQSRAGAPPPSNASGFPRHVAGASTPRAEAGRATTLGCDLCSMRMRPSAPTAPGDLLRLVRVILKVPARHVAEGVHRVEGEADNDQRPENRASVAVEVRVGNALVAARVAARPHTSTWM